MLISITEYGQKFKVRGWFQDNIWRSSILLVGLLLGSSPIAAADPIYQTVYEFFPSPEVGGAPSGPVTQSADGSFYGTTGDWQFSGLGNWGTVFRLSLAGEREQVVTFDGTNGCIPYGGLVWGDDTNLYGAAPGSWPWPVMNYGTIFRVTQGGDLTTLVTFYGPNGAYPAGPLVKNTDGSFYGMTTQGGQFDHGTIFRITTNGTLTTLLSFNGTNGSFPRALTKLPSGDLYGTTEFGGLNGIGTIFRLSTNGALVTLVQFDGTNGSRPTGPLILGFDQYLYGTTSQGTHSSGSVYKLSLQGTFTTLASLHHTNGAGPWGGVMQALDGNFYGITGWRYEGTNEAFGTVFQVSTNGTVRTIVRFDGTNAMNPFGSFTLGRDGLLYGVLSDLHKNPTFNGNVGSIFRLLPPPHILSLNFSNGAAVLAWTSLSNRSYMVEQVAFLTETNWSPAGPPITAVSSVTSATYFPTAKTGYYRVVLLP